MTRYYDQANLRAACAAIAAWLAAAPAAAQPPDPGFADALLGRWDLTVEADGAYPSWLEVRLRTETELMGRFVGRVGSVRHVGELTLRRGQGRVSRSRAIRERQADELRFEGALSGDRIEGTTRTEDGASVRFLATRAPSLARSGSVEWGEPAALFNGRDLDRLDAAQRGARRLLARAGGRARGESALRRSRQRRGVPRLSAACGAQVSAGQQQRRVFARPLRGADPRRRGQGARPAAHGRRLRLPRAIGRRRARRRRVADARRRARRAAGHGGVERHDDHRRPRDSRHHGRRARQRRECAGADHAPGRSRRRSSSAI